MSQNNYRVKKCVLKSIKQIVFKSPRRNGQVAKKFMLRPAYSSYLSYSIQALSCYTIQHTIRQKARLLLHGGGKTNFTGKIQWNISLKCDILRELHPTSFQTIPVYSTPDVYHTVMSKSSWQLKGSNKIHIHNFTSCTC